MAQDSVVECIDNFEKCLADQTGELSKHYNYNDIFFIDEDTPVEMYLMWWADTKGRRSDERFDDHNDDDDDWYDRDARRKQLTDVSITTGVVDQFIVGDFINTGITGPFSGNGRYIHGSCKDPRKTDRVDIIIETNN